MSSRDYPAKPYRSGRSEEKRDAPADVARCFVAVFPPESVLEAVLDVRRSLETMIPGVRWVASANLHFTVRFFGDLGASERKAAAEVIDRVAAERAGFDVELRGIGVFSSWKHPRVIWVGCGVGSDAFADLGRALEMGFRDARLGKADKPFKPHLTLGRWRDFGASVSEDVVARVSSIGALGTFAVNEVGLIQSRLSPKGSTYTPIHRARLG
ncbi:MAG TPA: RNA 2',3'-cyclic phosphodiesterase [Candidatus Eisenbacteria bacterium]|nr:RNA 2',3'-cyclic phosphodiesterase [Candidatus Eisenbacteria bacterium]